MVSGSDFAVQIESYRVLNGIWITNSHWEMVSLIHCVPHFCRMIHYLYYESSSRDLGIVPNISASLLNTLPLLFRVNTFTVSVCHLIWILNSSPGERGSTNIVLNATTLYLCLNHKCIFWVSVCDGDSQKVWEKRNHYLQTGGDFSYVKIFKHVSNTQNIITKLVATDLQANNLNKYHCSWLTATLFEIESRSYPWNNEKTLIFYVLMVKYFKWEIISLFAIILLYLYQIKMWYSSFILATYFLLLQCFNHVSWNTNLFL